MMKKLNTLLAATVIAAALSASPASAAVVFVAAGSSAIWQTAALAAYDRLSIGSGKAHYTIKGTCGTVWCAQLLDTRPDPKIVPQPGDLWIVWDSAGNVWTDLAVDSVVGVRAYLATPRAQLQVSSNVKTVAGQNLISAALWGADAPNVPAIVYNAINNAGLTAGFTDIRPEDAKFAETRATCPTSTPGCLGYQTSDPNVGPEIKSSYSSAFVQPVNFSLSGQKDPISGETVPFSVTIPIGAGPIIFFANHTSKKVTLPSTLAITQIDDAFSACPVIDGANLTSVVNEPLSGAMNTAEFTTFLNVAGPELPQENGVSPTADNPLDILCPGGTRRTRAIGTYELVGSVAANTVPSIGYAFFTYGNFAKIAQNPQYTYFAVENSTTSVDPIFNIHPANGELPACNAPCRTAPGTSFPNLRNGTYNAWSLLRVVTAPSGTNFTNTKNLVNAIDANINGTVPDFVPFNVETGGEPGLKVYRSHYPQSGVNPNNGIDTPNAEAGGDMGGCVEPVNRNVLSCKDFLYPPK